MKSLITRALYHPLVALSVFHLTDAMHNVDASPAGVLLALLAKLMSRALSVFNKG